MVVADILSGMDLWVSQRGNGRWANPEAPDVVTPIQQVRAEVEELVGIVIRLGLEDTALEIGLGDFGGTHMLWRMLFDKVVTVENDNAKIIKFRASEKLTDGRVILGDSHDPNLIKQLPAEVDLLFLDGDHTYAGVKEDYVRYSPLVRKGGLIVIHDYLLPGVKSFADELAKRGQDVHTIVKSTHVGIATEEVK